MYLIYDETANTQTWQRNIYYFGGVFDGTAYVGQNMVGGQQWGDEQKNGTALLNGTPVTYAHGKCCLPLGGYIYMTGSSGGLYRAADWKGTGGIPKITAPGSPEPLPESLATDGTYLFSNDGQSANYNKIHKWIVDHAAGTITEAPGWPITIGSLSGSTVTRFRGISYYNGKIYTTNFKDAGDHAIYEIDATTGAYTVLATAPRFSGGDNTYQCVRYGNQIFLVGLDCKLSTYQLNDSTWSLTSSVDLNIPLTAAPQAGYYGIAVKGDGAKARYIWISSASNQITFWDLAPWSDPACTVAEARNAKNNYPITVQDAVVTGIGPGGFWVENKARTGGAFVKWSGSMPSVDTTVGIKGSAGSSTTGEKVINATNVTPGTSYKMKPLLLTNRSLGPATGSTGLANDGMLVTVYGKVTYFNTDNGVFYIDDGSGVANDTTTAAGVKILGVNDLFYDSTPNAELIYTFQPCYAVVTGLMRLEKSGSNIIRRVSPRGPDDIIINPLP